MEVHINAHAAADKTKYNKQDIAFLALIYLRQFVVKPFKNKISILRVLYTRVVEAIFL